MTRYQTILLVTLIVWPLVIVALLFFMSRLEEYVARLDARTPEEAGLVPVRGANPEREVRIVVGDKVVGPRNDTDPEGREAGVSPSGATS